MNAHVNALIKKREEKAAEGDPDDDGKPWVIREKK